MNPAPGKSIRVLVVDDSPVVSEFLTQVLDADPELEVVGVAANGREALEAVRRTKPHVITMDIHMPHVDGFEATRNIMEACPTPIVIVSGSSTRDKASTNFYALEAGALAVVGRPRGVGHSHHHCSAKELVDTVKLMSEVKVVRRWIRPKPVPAPLQSSTQTLPTLPQVPVEVVAIGASTGGPLALQTILSALPRDFPVPVLIVQHMTPGFTEGFVEWLARSSGFAVRVAVDGERLLPARAYVAPDNFQMGVSPGRRIALVMGARENGMCPSVSFLFRSVTAVFGRHSAGVLLTGMGVDGVDELKMLKNAGALTLAQDEESSVVHGMPGQAIKDGAVACVLPPQGIAKALITSVAQS
jgi:two-component system, chemotaxis family, protein-glutamate methylesterase/glutaminase